MQLVSVSEQRPTSKGNNDPDNRAIGNTPTTTKGFAFGHGGNSNRHNGPGNTNGNSNYRKPFTNNRVYQNKRNDVKFNPNVKNVHKNNNNNHLTTNGQINGSAPQSSTVPMHSPILPATENPIVGDNNIAQVGIPALSKKIDGHQATTDNLFIAESNVSSLYDPISAMLL